MKPIIGLDDNSFRGIPYAIWKLRKRGVGMSSGLELNSSKKKILILSVVEVAVILILDIIMIAKVAGMAEPSGLKGMLIAFTVLSLIVVGVVAFLMIREGEEVNKESTVKSDKYKKLFLNLPIGFAQAEIVTPPGTNVPEFKIADANERFCEYLGLEPGAYQDKLLSNCKQDVLQSVNAWFRAYDNSGTKEGDLMAVEITMENLDKVFNTVMYKSEANYINMVLIDITEQKETEMSLSKAKDEANIAYKTQAEFLANMSHEIRTPINGILGMLQLTLAEDDLQADYRDNLVTAKNCADTLLRLINDILDISKLEAGKYNLRYEVFDVKSAIEETVAAQVPLANNKDLTLDCSFSGNIPEMVKGDGERIKQVLNCLLSNAIKFTSEGGVRVKVATMDGDEPDKTTLRIAVVDSGIGISDANKSKLFIRFSQVDSSDTRKYGGTGLGLVITKQIVELMGGNITVQSKEDIGSTFIVEIPLKIVKASEQKPEKKEDSAVISIKGHKRARILVAEDEPVNQQVIGKLLGMAGYSYDIAENGEKAVELFKQKTYDAALFDVQMPIMDGLAATQKIRAIEEEKGMKRLPIIAVTARAMFGDKERILEAKLDDYIAKPYNLNDVVETLNRYVSQKEEDEK